MEHFLTPYDEKQQQLIVTLHKLYPEWSVEKIIDYVKENTREYLFKLVDENVFPPQHQ
jgi:hypothetical protein